MMQGAAILGILFFFLHGFFPSVAFSAIFRYVDDEGIEHFTDTLNSVPPEYRNTVVNIDDHLLRAPGFMQEPHRQGDTFPERIAGGGKTFFRYWQESVRQTISVTWLKTVAIGIAFLALFILAGRAAGRSRHRNMAVVFRIVLTLLVMVYLLHTYVGTIADEFGQLREAALRIKNLSERRNDEVRRIMGGALPESAGGPESEEMPPDRGKRERTMPIAVR